MYKRRVNKEESFSSQNNQRYREDLLELKQTANTLIDRMLEFDLNFQEDLKDAFRIAEKLNNRVQDLFKDHLEDRRPRHQKQVRVEDLELVVEKIRNCHQEGLIGGNSTHIAVKNEKSFMIGTHFLKGIRVIEEESEVYSGKLHVRDASLYDIIYIPPVNSYFLASETKLYRKDIDDKPPYLFIDMNCGYRVGACLRYSRLHERMIINKDSRNISVIDPETKEIEIELERIGKGKIMDFRLFGEDQDQVVSVTEDGHVILIGLDYEEKRARVSQSEVKMIVEREDRPRSIAVCDENHFVLVEIGQWRKPYICSRTILFEVRDGILVNLASIDQHSQEIGCKWALECLGYFGVNVLWLGLSRNGPVQVYAYNIETGKLKELEDKGVSHEEKYPLRLHRLNDKFYYTGYNGRFMSLSLRKE